MDPIKRQIIVGEIERWRNSKLLPEHYCDFLLNLYIDEQEGSISSKGHHPPSAGVRRSIWKIFLIFSAISLFLVCSLYFTSFHPVMQIGLSLSVVGIFYGVGIVKRQNNPTIAYICIGLASIIMLFSGELILRINEWNSASAVMGTIAFSGALWVLIGIIARIGLLHFCGWVSIIMAYTWMIQWIHPEPKWYFVQFYIIPVCAILFIVGNKWLVSDRINGWISISISSLFFIIPEIYGLIFSNISQPILIISMICKILFLLIIVWLLLRKPKMKEWATG